MFGIIKKPKPDKDKQILDALSRLHDRVRDLIKWQIQKQADLDEMGNMVKELVDWQSQATAVIAKWETVFEALQGPNKATWGESKAEYSLKRVQEMQAEIRELKRRLGDA